MRYQQQDHHGQKYNGVLLNEGCVKSRILMKQLVVMLIAHTLPLDGNLDILLPMKDLDIFPNSIIQ